MLPALVIASSLGRERVLRGVMSLGGVGISVCANVLTTIVLANALPIATFGKVMLILTIGTIQAIILDFGLRTQVQRSAARRPTQHSFSQNWSAAILFAALSTFALSALSILAIASGTSWLVAAFLYGVAHWLSLFALSMAATYFGERRFRISILVGDLTKLALVLCAFATEMLSPFYALAAYMSGKALTIYFASINGQSITWAGMASASRRLRVHLRRGVLIWQAAVISIIGQRISDAFISAQLGFGAYGTYMVAMQAPSNFQRLIDAFRPVITANVFRRRSSGESAESASRLAFFQGNLIAFVSLAAAITLLPWLIRWIYPADYEQAIETGQLFLAGTLFTLNSYIAGLVLIGRGEDRKASYGAFALALCISGGLLLVFSYSPVDLYDVAQVIVISQALALGFYACLIGKSFIRYIFLAVLAGLLVLIGSAI